MLKKIISLLLTFATTLSLLPFSFQSASATSSEMSLSDKGIAYLKKEEGFSSKPYWDYGQWTVGYGSKCPGDKLEEYKANGISKEDAEVLLQSFITSFEKSVNEFIVSNSLNLSQNQFDALVCFSYNVGLGWMSNSLSGIRKAILNGDISSTFVRELTLWCKADGSILKELIERRLRDVNMFLNGDYTTKKPSTFGYVYYAANGGQVKNGVQGFIVSEAPPPYETPSYSGHEFMGWYTKQTGGELVQTLTSNLNGQTLYAHWDTAEGTESTPMKPVNVKVTGDEVNLREGCGTNYKKVDQAKRGDILTIAKTAEGTGYLWGESEKGWICLLYTNYNDVISGKVQEPSEDEAPDVTAPTLPESIEHIHKYSSSVSSPTCDKDGYTKHTCECGDTYSDSTTTPLGHSFGNWEEVKKPTTATEGSEKRVCSRCKKEEIRTIEKLPEPTVPSIPEESEEEDLQTVIDKGTVKVNDYLAIRSGAGTNFKEVGQLYNGNRVEIYEIETKNTAKWGKIKTGWICLSYVTLDSEPMAKPDTNHNNATLSPVRNPAPEIPKEETTINIKIPCYGVITVKDVLYVRWGPSTSYLAIDSLRNGSNVEILEVRNSNGMRWGRIGENRWINLDYVKIEEKVEQEDEVFNEEYFESNIETIPEENKNVELMLNVVMESNEEDLVEESNIIETEAFSECEVTDDFDKDNEMKKEPIWIVKIFLFIVDLIEKWLLK